MLETISFSVIVILFPPHKRKAEGCHAHITQHPSASSCFDFCKLLIHLPNFFRKLFQGRFGFRQFAGIQTARAVHSFGNLVQASRASAHQGGHLPDFRHVQDQHPPFQHQLSHKRLPTGDTGFSALLFNSFQFFLTHMKLNAEGSGFIDLITSLIDNKKPSTWQGKRFYCICILSYKQLFDLQLRGRELETSFILFYKCRNICKC